MSFDEYKNYMDETDGFLSWHQSSTASNRVPYPNPVYEYEIEANQRYLESKEKEQLLQQLENVRNLLLVEQEKENAKVRDETYKLKCRKEQELLVARRKLLKQALAKNPLIKINDIDDEMDLDDDVLPKSKRKYV